MLDFDLSFYFRVLRKWFWLVILVGGIAGGATYYFINQQPDAFSARTLVAVGTTLANPDPDLADVYLGEELVETYAQLVNIPSTLQPVIESLELDTTLSDLQAHIEAVPIVNTALIEIVVVWDDPETAAAIANGVGEQLLANNPSNVSDEIGRAHV